MKFPLTVVPAPGVVKTSIDMLPRIGFNNFTAPYDYVVLTTPGAGTTVSGNFIFRANAKYYIDGDFTAGSTITTSNTTTLDPTTIFMKAGAGILASGGVNFGDNVVFDGLNGAPWKGIAIGGNNGSSISGITIRNAGSAVFNTGSFTSDVKAAIYHFSNSSGVLSNSEIKDSQGYGLYNANPFSYLTLSNSTFINTALPAVSIQVDKVSSSISAGNTFTMTAGVAAVEVRAPNSSISPVGTWVALGGANYYLFTGSVFQSAGSWTLSPGVNLKFKAGKSLDIQAGLLTAIGTALSPITFDSEAGTAGTWAGIHIGSTSKLEFCQIKNGGDSFIFKFGVTQATEKANVVFNYGGGITTNTFKNNTITGSGGYGILVEATKQNPDAANGANSNTFSSNTSGNIIVK